MWTVRPDADGRWVPDWADTEPDPVPVPTIAWPNDPAHTVAHLLAWVNAELMKNVAEIGQLRLVQDASS
ncbi:hypothetical protein [Micromonospora craniellae]|uniref:hypothetical protein n=1 Tax=Micromonospora craniellae TaxID=2294034 RepID=UPI001CC70F28|nr:hypothetical protein [Micromonospora craniellae]